MATKYLVAAAVACAVVFGGATAWSQDGLATLEKRQATMKAISKDFGAVKNYLEDKGDLAAAVAGGADLEVKVKTIPDLFPKGTGMEQFPGKSGAKPGIWVEWDKFLAAQQTAAGKIAALNVALKGGDKAVIKAAFDDTGKVGCGGCHTPFREKL